MSLQSIMDERRQIRDRMLANGENPYPQDGHRSHSAAQALATSHETVVSVAGRIRSVRRMGKIQFFDLQDESGRIQAVFRQNETQAFDRLADVEVGDFLRAEGKRFVTKTGQESILATTFALLSKALRPLPDSYYGFSDEEERYRRRHLDLIMNPEVAEVFRKRSAIITAMRRVLDEEGFLEVETASLQPLYGGANARPFTTTINAFDGMEMYLKISDELYLKRLLVGGLDKVYEIDHNFRNEGLSYKHSPEFTMMECYAAYWDYRDMMALLERIYRAAAIAATGSDLVAYDRPTSSIDGETETVTLNFRDPWVRITMKDAIRQFLEIDVDALGDAELAAELTRVGGQVPTPFVRGLAIYALFGLVEHHFIQPTIVYDFPRETTSLCKPHRSDPALIERFEPYIAGMEIGNAYTELNDPVLQRQFMEEERGDEAHPLDVDFIEALEQGMPPAGGLGIGVDRMVMLLTNQRKLRDVMLFPIMKPRHGDGTSTPE